MITFSENLCRILKEKGHSQKWLAENTGMTEVSISRYMHGKRQPRAAGLKKIADALGVSPVELLAEEMPEVAKILPQLKPYIAENLKLHKEIDRLKGEVSRMNDFISERNKEISDLRHYHEDSGLKRDKPMPYRWRYDGKRVFEMCPVCDMMISNWQSYCHSCGQRIEQGNPKPEMEVKGE